ncbi:MAG TPA: D-ribose ABC transporter substrate-binding protein [Firmicutes bacterium]|nr:D-ribose ABC transporter substrate-binding protein [Bacillota bacterium]
MKRILVGLLVVSMLLLGTIGSYAQDITVAVAFCTLNIPFFVEMENGIREAAEEANIRLIVTNAEDKAAIQLSQVEDLIVQRPDALLLIPVDSDVLVSAVEAAHQANVPVLTIDRTVNSDKVITYVGVNDVVGGGIAGNYVIERLNGRGNVIMLEGVMGSSAQRDRALGFEQAIAEYPEIKLLTKQTANFNRVEGMNVTENLLQAYPEVDAIFAQNDEMALGALRAIEAAGKKDAIILVGYDADAEAKDAVRNGEMDATIEGSPYKLGLKGIEATLDYLNGETLPEQILLPLELVTQESLMD